MSGNKPIALLWFRDDLRLADHPALTAALAKGYAILPVYIDESPSPQLRPLGAASRVWLHHALTALDHEFKQRGSSLLIQRGEAQSVLKALIKATGAQALYWSRRYGEQERLIDSQIKNFARDRPANFS